MSQTSAYLFWSDSDGSGVDDLGHDPGSSIAGIEPDNSIAGIEPGSSTGSR